MRLAMTALVLALCLSTIAQNALAAKAPKVAIVVVGDADQTLREHAEAIERTLKSELRWPQDAAIANALKGQKAPLEDDGLNKLRAMRRSLGWKVSDDPVILRRVGKVTGADAMLVLRDPATPLLEVFDVEAGEFYEGELPIADVESNELHRFVLARANVAAKRSPFAKATEDKSQHFDENRRTKTGKKESLSSEALAKEERWFKKNWAYIVVGALLVGGATYLIVDRRNNNGSDPAMLELRPGAAAIRF